MGKVRTTTKTRKGVVHRRKTYKRSNTKRSNTKRLRRRRLSKKRGGGKHWWSRRKNVESIPTEEEPNEMSGPTEEEKYKKEWIDNEEKKRIEYNEPELHRDEAEEGANEAWNKYLTNKKAIAEFY